MSETKILMQYKRLEKQALQLEDVCKHQYSQIRAQASMLEEIICMANAGAMCIAWGMPLLSSDEALACVRSRPDDYKKELDEAEDAYFKLRQPLAGFK